MRKLIVAATAAVLLLTGCDPNPFIGARYITLPDGGEVVCVTYNQGGVDCDWEGTR